MNQTYRWNQAEHAAGYDAAAEHIHPHYLEMQERIISLLARMAPGAVAWQQQMWAVLEGVK